MPKPDLQNRQELISLLNEFYHRVRVDPLIGPIFNEVAHVEWEIHLPKIYDFWDSLLFQSNAYHGRPFPPHLPLGLNVDHFKRWLELFFAVIDENHQGPKANELKGRALQIGKNFLANLRAIRGEGVAGEGL